MQERIIYDIGSNNGDDISYYLLKADKVIAVEANSKHANEHVYQYATKTDNLK